jgi:amino acid adenylation domain-containing protein
VTVHAPASDPLSFAQQRVWLLHQLAHGSSPYNMTQVWRMRGRLDVAALDHALCALMTRHEILHTRFVAGKDEPRQIVMSDVRLELPVDDVHGCHESELQAIIRGESEKPFDLNVGPPLRTRLLRRGPDEHWLVIVLHHIVTDRWSQSVIATEVSELYRAHLTGTPSILTELPIQYADYAVWQREWFQGATLDEQLAFWRNALADLPELEIPTDHPRVTAANHASERVPFMLEADIVGALRALAQREGATLFMVLLAAFEVLLHRYSGQDDFAIGVPIAGRVRPELEGLIGFFVNTLVMRANVAEDPTFPQLLARVKNRALDAYAHQEMPFEKLVEVLAPRRDVHRNPLVQVCFAFQNAPRRDWNMPDLSVDRLHDMGAIGAKFDLDWAVNEGIGTLRGTVDFNTGLFDRVTIDRMVDQWLVLLRGIAADADRSITRFPLMDDTACDALVALGEGRRNAFDVSSLVDVIDAAARTSPDAIAVTCGEQSVTYRVLHSHANRLSRHLQSLSVGPGDTVGVWIEPAIDLVVALLAVLKSGAAYLPFDPAEPSERLRFMLGDTHASLLLTNSSLLSRAPSIEIRVLCLDRDRQIWSRLPDTPPSRSPTGCERACVLYTSGSTGAPKGVAIRHEGILRLVHRPNYIDIAPDDVVAQVSNIAFDAATFEIWGALANGARLAIMPRDVLLAPVRLESALRTHGVTCMFVTTALFNRIAIERPAALRALRWVLFGGETSVPQHVRAVLESGPPQHLLHVYGPTEATTFAACHRVERVEDALTVPVGVPIACTDLLVVDANGNLAPRGAIGEVLIGGTGVAEGYVGRPDITAERFIEHPLRRGSGERLYRTGDLARWRNDGTLEILGRNDDQIKLRGHRIEPGEVASALRRHPDVRACVVSARPQPSGERGLTAHVVLRSGAPYADAPAKLRRFLAVRLPGHMVPASFVRVDELPVTRNGKIDTSALRDPVATDLAIDAYESPRDEVERTLCAIWADVLRVPRVGIDDNFFDLGGHSLLAARLFARLDEAFPRAVPMSMLFEAPTVRSLASCYRDESDCDAGGLVFAITPSGSRPPVFAVPGVAGNAVGYVELARALGSDQPFYALQSIGLDGSAVPLDTITDIAQQHVSHIRALQPCGPYALIGACFGATVAYEMARQLIEAGDRIALLALLDPTARGGSPDARRPVRAPPLVRRAIDVATFCNERLALYRHELEQLQLLDRMRYVSRKLRGVTSTVVRSVRAGTPVREINHRAVYRANIAALDRYRHATLPAPVDIVAIVESAARAGEGRWLPEHLTQCGKVVVRRRVQGRDSGDMLSAHAVAVAAELDPLLRRAFSASPSQYPHMTSRAQTADRPSV